MIPYICIGIGNFYMAITVIILAVRDEKYP